MKACIYVEYLAHDGQPVWGPFLAERLEWTNQLGSQGPGTMSHFTPYGFPGLTHAIVAPKRNDYKLKFTEDGGQLFWDVQGGFLWDTNLSTDDPLGPEFSGVTWDAWLDNPVAQDRTITMQEIQDDASLLTDMWWGTPLSPYNWWNNGSGVNQTVIITDLIDSVLDGPDAIAFSIVFNGSRWINVPGKIDGRSAGQPYVIDPWDTSSIRQHINNIAALGDPWVANFTCEPDQTLIFFFMKNKDPNQDIIPDYLVNSVDQIAQIDWTEHGPAGTYVTGWASGSMKRWYTTTHIPSEEKFRRWRTNHLIGMRGQGYITQEQIEEGTKAYADKFPQRDLSLTIYPDKLDPYNRLTGFTNLCGKIVQFEWDTIPFTFRSPNGIFYIISQHFHADEAGNWLCDLGLQQIYTS